jgi:hypothetical protein
MDQLSFNTRRLNINLFLLISLNVIFFLVNGKFNTSIVDLGIEINTLFTLYLIGWMSLTVFYIFTMFKIKSLKLVKYCLIPLSILNFLWSCFLLTPLAKNISAEEGIWFSDFFFILIIPFQVYLNWIYQYKRKETILNKVVLICFILSAIFVFVYFFKYLISANFVNALIEFLLSTLVLGLLLTNICLIAFVIFVSFNHRFINKKRVD